MATTAADRILSLDIIRGIAVMGIFSVNVVGMAMIEAAYFDPPLYGFDHAYDRVMWAANFILVDGKFRSLFSILFGASMVLVIERGIAAGRKSWQVHYPRMIVLLLFGLAHFYFFWWGDILANYALVGMIAFVFWKLKPQWLVLAGVLSLTAMYAPMVQFGAQLATAPPEAAATAAEEAEFEQEFREELAEDNAAHSTLATHFVSTINGDEPLRPFDSVPGYGLETLGMMLLGMAGYKSGFLTGAWSRKRYAQVAAAFVGASLLLFGYACWRVFDANFEGNSFVWGVLFVFPMHPISALGYAALIMLVFRHRSAIGDRFAAVGRAAFTNYLGATMIGTLLFYDHGLDLYGKLSRGEAWLIVPVVWAIMLLWSKPWLDRFRYGPFEWAWRSLSRWKWEPLRRQPTATAVPETA